APARTPSAGAPGSVSSAVALPLSWRHLPGWRGARSMPLRRDLLLILLRRHQAVQRLAGLDLDLDQPALAVRVAGDGGRVVDQLLVDRRHLAVHRRIQVTDR